MEEETRECVKDCPAGAVTPPADGQAAGGGKGEQQEAGVGGVEMEVVAGTAVFFSKEETYCSIEQELWTPCSADCLQERYLDKACEKEAEVRASPLFVFNLLSYLSLWLWLWLSVAGHVPVLQAAWRLLLCTVAPRIVLGVS